MNKRGTCDVILRSIGVARGDHVSGGEAQYVDICGFLSLSKLSQNN